MITLPLFRRLFPLFAALAFAGSLPAQSASYRLAVVDVQAVLSQSTSGQAAVAKLQKLQQEKMAEAKKLDDAVRQLQAAGPEKSKEASAKRLELERFSQNSDREIGEARDRELQALEKKIGPVIEKVAAEMQLDAIFNKFESGLLFAAPRIDITDTVIKRFNEASR